MSPRRRVTSSVTPRLCCRGGRDGCGGRHRPHRGPRQRLAAQPEEGPGDRRDARRRPPRDGRRRRSPRLRERRPVRRDPRGRGGRRDPAGGTLEPTRGAARPSRTELRPILLRNSNCELIPIFELEFGLSKSRAGIELELPSFELESESESEKICVCGIRFGIAFHGIKIRYKVPRVLIYSRPSYTLCTK